MKLKEAAKEGGLLLGIIMLGILGVACLIALSIAPYALAILAGGWLLKSCGIL